MYKMQSDDTHAHTLLGAEVEVKSIGKTCSLMQKLFQTEVPSARLTVKPMGLPLRTNNYNAVSYEQEPTLLDNMSSPLFMLLQRE